MGTNMLYMGIQAVCPSVMIIRIVMSYIIHVGRNTPDLESKTSPGP